MRLSPQSLGFARGDTMKTKFTWLQKLRLPLPSWWEEKIRSGLCWLWQKIKQYPFITTGIFVVLIAVVFAVLVLIFGWDWTGFNSGASQKITISTSKGTTTAEVKQP